MHWVERASFEKIRRLLEISEQERHHEVLLIVKNLHDLSRHPSPYSVPIILLPLPLEIVEGEHFVTVDLLKLIPGNSSSPRKPETEATGQELVVYIQPGQPSSASEDFGPASQASRQVERGSRLECPSLVRKGSHPTPQASKKKNGTFRRQKVAGAKVEDFIPWVPPISRRPPKWEEKEEEDEMCHLIHAYVARKHKREDSSKQVADAISEVAGGSGQSLSDEGSKVQVIIILGLLEMGLNDQPDSKNVALAESREASPAPTTIQMVYPPE